MNEKLQYLYETNLIENLAAREFGLVKRGGLFEELNLDGVAEGIKGFVKEHVSADAPGGYVGSILSLMAPTILFRANPFIGIIYLVASQFGFDVAGIISKITNAIKPKLESGQPISASEISEIGKSVIAEEGGVEATAAPKDMFEPIKKYGQRYMASKYISSQLPETPGLFGGSGGLIQRIFGQLFSLPGGRGKSKALWLIGGFIIWIVKTVLLGAGLLAGAEAISKHLGHKPETIHEQSQEKPVENQTAQPPISEEKHEAVQELNLQPRGSGDMWVLPVINGSIDDTILAWCKEFAPDKFALNSDIMDKIKNSPNYIKIKTILSNPKNFSSKYLVMPEQFTSRKQVSDLIMKDIDA
jgi:hypothetical protein